MKEYAQSVAQQALENAYNNLQTDDIIKLAWGNIKRSITNSDNIPQ